MIKYSIVLPDYCFIIAFSQFEDTLNIFVYILGHEKCCICIVIIDELVVLNIYSLYTVREH